MKKNKITWAALLLMAPYGVFAQQHLTIKEVMHLAVSQSKEAKAADTKAMGKQLNINVAKDNVLPEASVSGQVSYMTTPNVDIKLPIGPSSGLNVNPHMLMLGMASVNMPLYTGGKIKGGIQMAELAYDAESWNAHTVKEKLALKAVSLYLALYKAQQSHTLIEENIKRAEKRVNDFQAMVTNGLMAKNDLLKAELQVSNYQLALQDAKKNINVLNYQLATLLKLDPNTSIEQINLEDAGNVAVKSENADQNSNDRSEIKAMQANQKMVQQQIKVTKADYYPTIFATAGYNAINLKNVAVITNAATIGAGVKYNISSLYKNANHVKVAENQLKELEEGMTVLQDNIKVQVQQATEDYQLALNQNSLYGKALLQADENYRITKDKYDNGVADTDDLLEADVQQLQARINVEIGKANSIEKYYNLLLAKGNLNIENN